MLDAAPLSAALFLVSASCTLLYLYTPELLPTRVSGCEAVHCRVQSTRQVGRALRGGQVGFAVASRPTIALL